MKKTEAAGPAKGRALINSAVKFMTKLTKEKKTKAEKDFFVLDSWIKKQTDFLNYRIQRAMANFQKKYHIKT